MKRLSPLKATCAGLLIGVALIAALGAGLTKWVGQFYGDGAGLTNITASGTISAAILTNSVLKFQLDATFEDTVKKEGSHGMLLQYDRIDGGSSTLLFRTTDDSIHFPSSTFIFDGISSPTALGLDSGGHPVAIDSSAPINNFFATNVYVTSNHVDVINSYNSNVITINTNVTVNGNITVNGKSTFNQITVSALTNSAWTANTVLKASANKDAISIANSAGLLSNDGTGPAYTLTPGVNDLYLTNNFYGSTNPVTGANVDASLGEQVTNCTANPTISGIANVKTGLGFRNVLYILANGADRTVTYSVGNVKKIPTGTWVVTNGSFGTLVSGGIGGTITGAVFTPFGP